MKENRLVLALVLILVVSTSTLYAQSVDTSNIKEHFDRILHTESFRNYTNRENLHQVGTYIYQTFKHYADTAFFQEYLVNGKPYRNVVCVYGSSNTETIVVGAHYDVHDNQDGADDNASGIVGLLELARLLENQSLPYRIELVAYTLEEPPFFRTDFMGSSIHAKSLADQKRAVYGMVCLEMIGYFSDAKHSQSYPIAPLSLVYGNKGDYIALINKIQKGRFSRKFQRSFKKQNIIRTKQLSAPSWVPGIDFSDHLNYWKLGFSAVMITNTAFYRNPNYHKSSDTLETLDLKRMAKVIETVYLTLISMS